MLHPKDDYIIEQDSRTGQYQVFHETYGYIRVNGTATTEEVERGLWATFEEAQNVVGRRIAAISAYYGDGSRLEECWRVNFPNSLSLAEAIAYVVTMDGEAYARLTMPAYDDNRIINVPMTMRDAGMVAALYGLTGVTEYIKARRTGTATQLAYGERE